MELDFVCVCVCVMMGRRIEALQCRGGSLSEKEKNLEMQIRYESEYLL